jgi:hypothetical protein
LLCAGVWLATSSHALAEGPEPTVSQLLVDPKDDRHLALRSNFGLMVSHDAGASWDWRCKAGLGCRGNAEPPVAILNGGALVLGLPTGIVTGDAAGCDFKPASGIAANVVDLAAIPETPGGALAVSVAFSDSSSQLWKSLDNGRSFQALGAELQHFTALSIGVPSALADRVYMTGLLWAASVKGAIAVSDDGGRAFTLIGMADTDSGAQPYFVASDPKRLDTVYVRLTGIPGRLRVSDDAGRSFHEVLSIPGPLQAVTLSSSGEEIFASSLEAGTYRADTTSLKFIQVACGGLPCLAATSTALLGCGTRSRDGFLVGRSLDGGQNFAVLLDTPCLVPARCGASTSVGATCAQDWKRVSAQLSQPGAPCDGTATSKPFSRACFSSGGGNGTGLNAARPDIEVAHVRSAHARPIKLARGAGCGCVLSRAPTKQSDFHLQLAALLVATVGRRARRRSSRAALHGA